MAETRTPVRYPRDTPFEALPTLMLERLASALSRHGELLYERLFGLHLSECRVIGIVMSQEPISLRGACERLEVDKGHVSRMVARLVGAGFLERRPDPADRRSFYLVLTPTGRRLATRIRAAAAERNREWIAGLGPELQARSFLEALHTQTMQARGMLARETKKKTGRSLPSTASAAEVAGPVPLLVDRPLLEDMRRTLDRLLGDS